MNDSLQDHLARLRRIAARDAGADRGMRSGDGPDALAARAALAHIDSLAAESRFQARRYQAMHRRAQAAEGALIAARNQAKDWQRAWAAVCRGAKTLANRERRQRRRANRLHAFVDIAERLQRAHDPLYRIIAIGREFQ